MARWRRGLGRARRGFSLVELMIVVAIIGILASIAVPNFLFLRCKAKRTEAYSLIGALKSFQNVYFQESGNFVCNPAELQGLGYDYSSHMYTTINLACTYSPDAYVVEIESKIIGPSGNKDKIVSSDTGIVTLVDGCY